MSKKNKNKNITMQFKPDEDEKYWDKTDNNEIFKYNKPIEDIEFSITQKMIDDTKTLKDSLNYDNKTEYNICKYYKLYDVEDKMDACIMCSRVPIEITIMNELINLNNRGTGKFTQCSLLNIRYKLLEVYKVKKGLFFKTDFDKIKLRLEEENNIVRIDNKRKNKAGPNKKKDSSGQAESNISSTLMIDKYKYYINKLVDKTKDKHNYYIYKLVDEKYIYVCGGYNKLKKRDIDEFIENNCINFEGKVKAEIIKQIEIHSELEGKIIVDDEIKNSDSIKNGLNRYYNIFNEIKFNSDEIFMMIQREKINNIKTIKIDGGFIASININEKRYIFSDLNNSIYNMLDYFYLMRKHNMKEYDKIIELLKITKFEDIKIELLEKNIQECDLGKKIIEHINYYDKDILLNYNEEYYATPEDIKNVKNIVFAKKKT